MPVDHPLLVVTLRGVQSAFDSRWGWRSDDAGVVEELDRLTPLSTPDIPDWAGYAADALSEQLSPDLVVLYRSPPDHVPGRVY